MGLLGRFGIGGLAQRGEGAGLVGEVVGGPDADHGLDGLIEDLVAVVEVDAEGFELGF